MHLGVKWKSFFNARPLVSAEQRAEKRVMSRFGAFTRTSARRSIRKRKKASKPGAPPNSHTGFLRNGIFFSYERIRGSVVIGPEFQQKEGVDTPLVLEEGGRSTRTVRERRGKSRVRRRKATNVKARPYMGPAFSTAKKSLLPDIWRNQIR